MKRQSAIGSRQSRCRDGLSECHILRVREPGHRPGHLITTYDCRLPIADCRRLPTADCRLPVRHDYRRLHDPAIHPLPGYWATVWRRFRRDPVAVGAGLVIIALVLVAILAPYVAPADPYKGMTLRRLRPIGTDGFPLGTDELGRDILSRLIHGARLSLFMGVTPVFLALLAGRQHRHRRRLRRRLAQCRADAHHGRVLRVPLGAAGDCAVGRARCRHRQRTDLADCRVHPADRAGCRERDHRRTHARLCRGGPRVSGAGAVAIIRSHVLGNVLGPIFVYAMSLIAVSMILASGLSFLGLGVKPPEPEWGLMLNTLRTAIYTQPWVRAAGTDDLHHLDLIQHADRRAAVGHGHQGLTDADGGRDRGVGLGTAAAPPPAKAMLSVRDLVKHFPVRSGVFGRARLWFGPLTASASTCCRARRSASSANRVAESRPPRGC